LNAHLTSTATTPATDAPAAAGPSLPAEGDARYAEAVAAYNLAAEISPQFAVTVGSPSPLSCSSRQGKRS